MTSKYTTEPQGKTTTKKKTQHDTDTKKRCKDEWNRIKDQDMNPQPLQQMLLGKVVICLQKTETTSMPVHPV
jgi:hypothetical protein